MSKFKNSTGYKIIENWMHQINHTQDNTRDSSFVGKTNYVSDLTLEVFTKDGSLASDKWKFINCFPTSLDAVDLAWESNDTIMEFTTTWSYDYFEHGNSTAL